MSKVCDAEEIDQIAIRYAADCPRWLKRCHVPRFVAISASPGPCSQTLPGQPCLNVMDFDRHLSQVHEHLSQAMTALAQSLSHGPPSTTDELVAVAQLLTDAQMRLLRLRKAGKADGTEIEQTPPQQQP